MEDIRKNIEKFRNFTLNEQVDDRLTVNDLEALKRINYGVSRDEVIQWHNENDIEYQYSSDIEMYIKYLENHLAM
jgi:hypothetical protein